MLTKEQFVETFNDYLLAHGYARWESWDINVEWGRYQRGRSWSNEFFVQAEIQASVDAAYEAMSEEERAAMWKEDAEDARRRAHEPEMVMVPIDIHPLDNSNGAAVIELLRHPPSAVEFDDQNEYYDAWWKQLLNAATL